MSRGHCGYFAAQQPRLVRGTTTTGSFTAPEDKAREADTLVSDVVAFMRAGGKVEVIGGTTPVRASARRKAAR